MLCNKISENPRKGFLQLLARGMNKIKKRIYFRTPRHSSFLFAPGHGMFHGKRCILGRPNVHITKHIIRVWTVEFLCTLLGNVNGFCVLGVMFGREHYRAAI